MLIEVTENELKTIKNALCNNINSLKETNHNLREDFEYEAYKYIVVDEYRRKILGNKDKIATIQKLLDNLKPVEISKPKRGGDSCDYYNPSRHDLEEILHDGSDRWASNDFQRAWSGYPTGRRF